MKNRMGPRILMGLFTGPRIVNTRLKNTSESQGMFFGDIWNTILKFFLKIKKPSLFSSAIPPALSTTTAWKDRDPIVKL